MKKKILVFAGLLVILLSFLWGCGPVRKMFTSGDSAAICESGNNLSDIKIGILIYSLSDDFMSRFSEETIKYLTELGFSSENVKVYDAINNKDTQLDQVEMLIDQGYNALIVNPVNTGIVHTITDMAANAGVPVIYINREPEASEESRWEDYGLNITYVGCDARQSGIYQGELILDLDKAVLDKNGDGTIKYYLIEGAPENIDARYRSEYSVATVTHEGWSMDCIYTGVGNWDTSTAQQLVTKALVQHPEVELIICNNDAMAIGAIEALNAAKIKPGKDILVVGVDALPQALEYVLDGSLSGTVFNDYISQSHNAVDAALRYIHGEDNPHYIGCDYIKVNKENAEDILKLVSE